MAPIMTAVEFIFRPIEAIKSHTSKSLYLLIEHEGHHIVSRGIHVLNSFWTLVTPFISYTLVSAWMMVETSFQSYIFFLLTCYVFENYPLSIRQSILTLYQKFYSLSPTKSIN